ncbi:MAG: hypothetical protein ACI4M2_02705 [Christensenellales bacterium]
MPYGECKIYFDGSHYIGIPHTTRPSRRRPKPPEEEIVVTEKETEPPTETEENVRAEESAPSNDDAPIALEKNTEMSESEYEPQPEPQPKVRTMTRKELFEELYQKYLNKPRRIKLELIAKEMLPYFKTEELSRLYVNENIERKLRNLIARRIRLTRKANLQEFNYFVTFTYDGKLHTEDSFRKGLKNCLRHLVERKQWKYIGVWERSPEKQRLHFHGIFYIPEGTMPGMLLDVNDYNFNTHNRQITHQNTYFNERFGRSDFELIDDMDKMGDALSYIMKYIEKSGEKIVYSKGLPQFFISDVMDEDIICFTGLEDKKLLLSDDFTCWDEGCYVGKVSKAVIAQLRKCN